jgi:hypothetical protein
MQVQKCAQLVLAAQESVQTLMAQKILLQTTLHLK